MGRGFLLRKGEQKKRITKLVVDQFYYQKFTKGDRFLSPTTYTFSSIGVLSNMSHLHVRGILVGLSFQTPPIWLNEILETREQSSWERVGTERRWLKIPKGGENCFRTRTSSFLPRRTRRRSPSCRIQRWSVASSSRPWNLFLLGWIQYTYRLEIDFSDHSFFFFPCSLVPLDNRVNQGCRKNNNYSHY